MDTDELKRLEARAWNYRESFAGIIQGNCDDCGNCDDDADGNCLCDRIVHSLIEAVIGIDEEAADEDAALLRLQDRVKELEEANEWKPIDENTPHETEVLLLCRAGEREWQEVGFASQGRRVNLGPGLGAASTMSWHGYAVKWRPLPEPPREIT